MIFLHLLASDLGQVAPFQFARFPDLQKENGHLACSQVVMRLEGGARV